MCEVDIGGVNNINTKNEFDMKNLNPTIELEQILGGQIYDALQGGVVEAVLKKAKLNSGDEYWRSNMEGHSIKITQPLLGDLFALCQEVKERLGFEEAVDFYVTGDSTVNAFSVAAAEEGMPHIVNLNSSLVSLMTEDELRFVIGHELGHLINRDSALKRLIMFVFPPDNTTPPMTLQYKIRLHDQLAELVADRYGYMAVGKVDACVTAFFKMASGLDLAKMNVSMDALLEDNSRHLDYFLKDKGLNRASHPVNPIRVQALNLFAGAESEEELSAGMEPLVSILMKVGNSPIDEYMADFIASVGLIVAGVDNEVTSEEVNHIISTLAPMTIFPRVYLDEIAKANVSEVFSKAITAILDIDPGMRGSMLRYVMSLVLSDKDIAEKELEFIYSFGANLGFGEKEISTMFAETIQREYVPSLNSIC